MGPHPFGPHVLLCEWLIWYPIRWSTQMYPFRGGHFTPGPTMADQEVTVGIPSSDALITRLVAFCSDSSIEATFATFYRKHADKFHGFSADEEKQHLVYEMFQEYELVFERVINDFLTQEQMAPDEFFDHCRRLLRSKKQEDAATNLQIVLSAMDFDAFCVLMEREAIETQQALKAAEDMGL